MNKKVVKVPYKRANTGFFEALGFRGFLEYPVCTILISILHKQCYSSHLNEKNALIIELLVSLRAEEVLNIGEERVCF